MGSSESSQQQQQQKERQRQAEVRQTEAQQTRILKERNDNEVAKQQERIRIEIINAECRTEQRVRSYEVQKRSEMFHSGMSQFQNDETGFRAITYAQSKLN